MFAAQMVWADPVRGAAEFLAPTAVHAEQGQNHSAPPDKARSTEPGKPAPGSSASSGSNTTAQGQKVERRDQSHEAEKTPNWLEFLKIVVSWPALFALLVLYFAFSRLAPLKLARILRPFRSLKLFGAEFVLSEEVGTDAEQAIEIYRKQAKRQFDTLVEINDIRAKLEAVLDKVRPAIEKRKTIPDLRCTIHVPDILFAETLYQLLDYFPRGGGRGRTFSTRFGIIGRCWRSRESQIGGTIPTDPQELIRNWGMTREQALASGQGRQSFAAIPLCDESGTQVAIFYLDSTEKNAFAADDDTTFRKTLIDTIVDGSKNNLTSALMKMRDDLKGRRLMIHIHEE
jgi:hypothetical protein